MSVIYAYIDPSNYPNVGKYAIHGVSGDHVTVDLQSPTVMEKSHLLDTLSISKSIYVHIEVTPLLQFPPL